MMPCSFCVNDFKLREVPDSDLLRSAVATASDELKLSLRLLTELPPLLLLLRPRLLLLLLLLDPERFRLSLMEEDDSFPCFLRRVFRRGLEAVLDSRLEG